MKAKIQVLPSYLIDQIAAGEVVDRPASVVKELVENSLDAHASTIKIQVRDGGKALIRVTDDGDGMSRDDLAMCVVRHATSKIRTANDMDSISTLGFRGEALPSIAAVSKLTITSRTRRDEVGTRLSLSADTKLELSDAGCAPGTDIEVRELFFNTPARLKFLRTPATEMSHVSAWITHLGLMRPDVHITLINNGRKVIDAPRHVDLAQRVSSLLGRESFDHLHEFELDDPGVHISGLVSDPGHSRPNTKGIHLFVNGRFVRDRLLQYAVMEAYRTVLPDRRFPLVVAKLELDPELVDVNVHPQKIEVRFSDSRRVQRALTSGIVQVLAKSPWMNFGDTVSEKHVSAYGYYSTRSSEEQTAGSHREARVKKALSDFNLSSQNFVPGGSFRSQRFKKTTFGAAREQEASGFFSQQRRSLSEMQLVGTLWNTYIALCDEERMVLIDQHAAHERITFERLKEEEEKKGVRSQRLLVPLQVEIEPELLSVAEAESAILLSTGFEMEPFGPGVLSVKAVPELLLDAPVVELVRDTLSELMETRQMASWETRRLALLSTMACHGSVRAKKRMGEDEIRSLLRQMERVDFGGQCPHGRPVMVEFRRSEVEHWFHRG